ncbi:MAG: hypothetical protein M1819_003566 [Sarea resinae]|nr:MAG: hypothetical protein M1819_003566 [Sarea resinae]
MSTALQNDTSGSGSGGGAPSSSDSPSPVVLMALITKKQGLSWDEFSDYWKNRHRQLVSPWLERRGVLKYRQIHLSPTASTLINGPSSSSGALDGSATNPSGGVPILPYDGILELELASYQTWADMLQDPYYTDVVVHDERKFFDATKIVMGLGFGVVGVEGGRAVV